MSGETMIPTPRYAIGQLVFAAELHKAPVEVTCPDCLGTREWSAASPAGETYRIECPRCSGYAGDVSLSRKVWLWSVSVRPLTIGSVRMDTADEERPISYMCHETGVGSGRIWSESEIHLTEDEAGADGAVRLAEMEAAEAQRETPEVLRERCLRDIKLREAVVADARSQVFHSWYTYRRLVEDVEGVIDGDAKDATELRAELREVLAWETGHREGHPLAVIVDALRNAVDAWRAEHPGATEPAWAGVADAELASLLAPLPQEPAR